MKIQALILLAALTPHTAPRLLGQAEPAPAAPAAGAPSQTQPPGAPAHDFKYFFTASNAAFEASFDQAGIKTDRDGNKLVTIKMTKFSGAFRNWIKANFPGGETAEWATDSYSIECESKRVSEHEIVWFDSTGEELAEFDFGGVMSTPITYSMKDNLMKKMCGLQ